MGASEGLKVVEDPKKKSRDALAARVKPVAVDAPAPAPAVQTQALAPVGSSKGIVSGFRGNNPGQGGPGEFFTAPTPSGAGTVNVQPGGPDSKYPGGGADPAKAAAERAQRDAEEAKRKLEQSRATAESNENRQDRRERQDELSRGARASRRRGSILTSPLGTIGDLASAISKTLLGQ